MAFGEKYFATWDDFGGTEHEIKLLQDGGSGTTQLTVLQKMPYERSVRGSKKAQIENQVFGSEIKFNFVVGSADIAAIDAILESDYKEWKIEHYYNSVLDGVFWLQPDNFSRDYVKLGDYYFISFSGVDGLGNLKNIEFTNFTDDSQYEDRVSIMTTLKRALEHVGFELDFRVQLGTWCTNDSLMASTECALDKVTHDSRRFQKTKDGRLTNTNIYEVISELLEPFSCYLIQSQAQYWIINTREDNSFYFPIPWTTLTVGSRTASDIKIDITGNEDFDNRGNFQKIRPLEVVGATFRDRNVRDNSLTNGDFHLNNTNEWVEGTGFESFQTVAFESNYELETTIVIAGGEPSEPPNFHSVAQAIVVRGETDQIQVQFKVRCAELTMDAGFSGESFDAFVKVSCQIRKGTASGDIINPGGGPILLSTANPEYRLYKYFMDITEDDDYFIEILIDKLESTAWADYDTINIRFDDFDIIAAYSTGEDITFDTYHKVSNADSSFTDFLDIDLKFGDSSSDTDIGAFKIGVTRTETWSRFGKTEDTSINFLVAKNIIENFSKYKDYIRLTIIDDTDRILPHSLIEINSSVYQMVSQTATFPGGLRKELKVELNEVLNAAVNVTIREVGLSSVDGDGDNSSPFTDAVTNPTTNPSNPSLSTPTLQQVTNVGNLTTNNIGITSADNSFFTGGGNVGIDTDSPTSKLHVETSAWNAGSNIPFVNFTNLDVNAVDGNTLLVRGGANDPQSQTFEVQDFDGNTDFVVLGTGNVGIGTTSPATALEVNGVINASTNLQEGGINLSAIYEQIITGAATTIVSSDLTINRALLSNGSGKVAVSSVTSAELGYVSGVTSSIQTQINGKAKIQSGTWTPTLAGHTLSNEFGYYHRSGDIVVINAYFTMPITASTGNMYINTLPFPSTDFADGVTELWLGSFRLAAGGGAHISNSHIEVSENVSYIQFVDAAGIMDPADFSEDTIILSITYTTDSA